MSDLAARREARRRKILENSENRLKRITGVEQKNDISIDGVALHVTNSNTLNELENVSVSTNSVETRDSVSTVSSKTTTTTTTNNIKVVREEYYVSIFAIVYSLILSTYQRYETHFSKTSAELHLNQIFIPLLLYEIISFVYCPPPNITLMQRLIIQGTKNQFVAYYVKYFGHLMKLMKHLMIYFVVFNACFFIFTI